jgi:hypothetical protein
MREISEFLNNKNNYIIYYLFNYFVMREISEFLNNKNNYIIYKYNEFIETKFERKYKI